MDLLRRYVHLFICSYLKSAYTIEKKENDNTFGSEQMKDHHAYPAPNEYFNLAQDTKFSSGTSGLFLSHY